jgi:methionyl-tRNA formyltransferase
MRAVVFAYHNVGVRCLKVLLARGIDVALVVTHEDNPAETIWFESVAAVCREHGIAFVTPADPHSPDLFAQVQAARPDFIFSFYYRHMLPVPLLELARKGAYNMHGSLLPKYRGRVPVNWAVLHGETETGATLHEMAAKPDAGAIVAQTSVPILPDDTAFEVFGKVTVAAEQTLWNVLPALLADRAPKLPNDLSKGSYFGGRKPEDGRIDWTQPAQAIYNLHRAVAPPYPGAWTVIAGKTFIIGKARLMVSYKSDLLPGLTVVDNRILGVGGDGRAVLIHELLMDGTPVSPTEFHQILLSSRANPSKAIK